MKNTKPTAFATVTKEANIAAEAARIRFAELKWQSMKETFREMSKTGEAYTIAEIAKMSGLTQSQVRSHLCNHRCGLTNVFSDFGGPVKVTEGTVTYKYARLEEDESGEHVTNNTHTRQYYCNLITADK